MNCQPNEVVKQINEQQSSSRQSNHIGKQTSNKGQPNRYQCPMPMQGKIITA